MLKIRKHIVTTIAKANMGGGAIVGSNWAANVDGRDNKIRFGEDELV